MKGFGDEKKERGVEEEWVKEEEQEQEGEKKQKKKDQKEEKQKKEKHIESTKRVQGKASLQLHHRGGIKSG